ncbi:MAG: thioesterase family protein [Phenylobacterium sp.]|uniref:thioesterase family protein n=1 Tax=Phenylobacterium sp. TaxID=1871053 RepID=UPI0027337CEE|nr:thioesterase family protein [Phenylobacterium sp.]MDP3174667.1 thioesterase family protein [Phenylobacterium sp.]
MDEQGVEVWSGRANTWECDQMGHMNVRFHVAKAIEGLASMTAELGLPRAFAATAEATLMVREQHIRFLREALPGAGLVMTGQVTDIGESDARILLVLRHMSGEPASTFHTTVEHVTAREQRPFPWPKRVLERAEALTGVVPAFAAPRGLDAGPVTTQASLERARELGMVRTSMGVVSAADCDAFGRMRPEMLIARIAEGLARLNLHAPAGEAAEPKMDGAALEYRLLHHAWPRAGDRVATFGGLAEANQRTRRLVHWTVDPDTGRAVGSAEAVAANLDLEARKMVTLSPQALADAQARVIAGLTL